VLSDAVAERGHSCRTLKEPRLPEYTEYYIELVDGVKERKKEANNKERKLKQHTAQILMYNVDHKSFDI
jgi:hypothetical protein